MPEATYLNPELSERLLSARSEYLLQSQHSCQHCARCSRWHKVCPRTTVKRAALQPDIGIVALYSSTRFGHTVSISAIRCGNLRHHQIRRPGTNTSSPLRAVYLASRATPPPTARLRLSMNEAIRPLGKYDPVVFPRQPSVASPC